MADIRPFKAVRPNVDIAERVAALPYDVYNRKEAKEETLREPLSFLCIDRAESQLGDDVDTYDEKVYKKASSLFDEWQNTRVFIEESKPYFYIYELIMDGRHQTGVVGCASIDDYVNGIIKKHENTRADKEEDRIRHVDALSAQTGPIFLAYRRNDAIKTILDRVKATDPLYDFTSPDNITHRCWIIENDKDIDAVSEAFKNAGSIYIADGHHRCASACKVGLKRREQHPGYSPDCEFNYFLSVLFDEQELAIMDYNRVVKDLNGMSISDVIDKLGSIGCLKEIGDTPYKPDKKGTVGVYLDNKWYSLEFDASLLSDDPVKGLDVSVLQDNILGPMFGITDPKTDKRIDFIGGIRGLGELEKRCHEDCKIAFSMFPTSISELFDVADAGRLMPPKSTWFEPKLRSGLFIHKIER